MTQQNIITFTKVKQPYGWLGNMAPYKMVYNNLEFKTSEASFQAMRFSDNLIIEDIRSRTSPMSAKMCAKKNKEKMIVTPMSDKDVENMKLTLLLKLKYNPELIQKLLETNNSQIIEDTTARPNTSGLFWGQAMIESHWTGKNILGKLWMKIR